MPILKAFDNESANNRLNADPANRRSFCGTRKLTYCHKSPHCFAVPVNLSRSVDASHRTTRLIKPTSAIKAFSFSVLAAIRRPVRHQRNEIRRKEFDSMRHSRNADASDRVLPHDSGQGLSGRICREQLGPGRSPGLVRRL